MFPPPGPGVARTGPDPVSSRLLSGALLATVLAAFVYFVGPGMGGHFNVDDPMNIHYYWSRGWQALLGHLAAFFSTYQRPAGGLYFLGLYQAFGLNPAPYHVVQAAFLLANCWLAFALTSRLAASRLAGGLAALGVCYHARLAALVYFPSYIFDVLCFGFYLGSLFYYVSIRSRAERLRLRQNLTFLLLYLLALESKEMAVTLPLAVLAYECVYRTEGSALRSLRNAWQPILAATLVTGAFIIGKTLGPDSLTALADYRPVLSWAQYWESTGRFLNTIFYQDESNGLFRESWRIVALAGALLLLSLRLRRREMVLFWCLIWITPLPITFLPARGGALLYLPLFAWAGFGASLAARFLELGGHALRRRPLPRTAAVTLLLAALVTGWWAKTAHENRYIKPALAAAGDRTWHAIQQACAFRVASGSSVYVASDPFLGWDAKFILELCFRDPSVQVWLGKLQSLPAAQIESMDYIFTFSGDSLERLKPPPDAP